MVEEALPLCEEDDLAIPVLEHVLEQHMSRLNLDRMTVCEKLTAGDIQIVYTFLESVLII